MQYLQFRKRQDIDIRIVDMSFRKCDVLHLRAHCKRPKHATTGPRKVSSLFCLDVEDMENVSDTVEQCVGVNEIYVVESVCLESIRVS